MDTIARIPHQKMREETNAFAGLHAQRDQGHGKRDYLSE